MKVKDLVLCALFCALIILGGFLKIYIPPFPVMFTMQTFFILLSSYVIGAKKSMVAVIMYIVIGLIGVPIFSTGGGFGYVLSPTFGFLIGFIPASYVCGKLSENMKKLNILPAIIALIIIYVIGASYFFIIQNLYFSKFVSVWNVVSGCVLVFLPFDCILSVLVLIIAKRINKAKVM